MASATWPSTLPQTFQQQSFTENSVSGVVRTEMDTGFAKTRLRFTATPDMWQGEMVLTKEEVATFKTFFKNDIAWGALKFNFPNQYDLLTMVEARIVIDTDGTPYTLVPDGESQDFKLKYTLEVFDL